MSRYVIGIDLGTTNSVLAYTPLETESAEVALLPIPQLVDVGTVESRTHLPSFVYLATEKEAEGTDLALPWRERSDFAVGEFARRRSAEAPARTVGAAKSWLCHSRVDRHEAILPWNAPAEVAKISPVEASRRYLAHLCAAWHHAFPDVPIAEQQVVLTVPASFDASARELTREAASLAGFNPETLLLLEEPQAAVYSWLSDLGDRWRSSLSTGDRVLVCDVGGGTTDLTLIGVEEHEGDLQLKRIAVGEHLLVGGDNMDLALAHFAAGLFSEKGTKLDPWQSVALWHSCRAAKEKLLVENGPETQTISVLGRGSKLIGGTVSADLPRRESASLLADGFFPECRLDARPKRHAMSGFREIGLPFEQDTAITRHLASFLHRHQEEASPRMPTHLLLNGGVFKAEVLRTRLLDVLRGWSDEATLEVLNDQLPEESGGNLDHAVARGAAYYGWAKERGGVRIRGGTARSYYIGIETAGLAIPGAPRPLRALCVAPQGMEEGTETDVPSSEIGLVVGEPAHFRFFSSTVRKEDCAGDLLEPSVIDHADAPEAELQESDTMETVLPRDEVEEDDWVPVQFQTRVTELGVLELWCLAVRGEGRWKLEFSVRESGD
jgi:hypothetical protein